MKTVGLLAALVGVSVAASPVMAASLNSKDRARVARAAPKDRDDVRYCLLKGKEGRDKGTVIGAAGGAGVGAGEGAAVVGCGVGRSDGAGVGLGMGALVGSPGPTVGESVGEGVGRGVGAQASPCTTPQDVDSHGVPVNASTSPMSSSTHQPRSWSKAEAPPNIQTIVVTPEVSHAPMSWLKAGASWNM